MSNRFLLPMHNLVSVKGIKTNQIGTAVERSAETQIHDPSFQARPKVPKSSSILKAGLLKNPETETQLKNVSIHNSNRKRYSEPVHTN